MKFRKLPIEVEAIQFTGENWDEMTEFLQHKIWPCNQIDIHTHEGVMRAGIGDWVVRGIEGEIYPVKNHIFQKTYIEVPIFEACPAIFDPEHYPEDREP